MQNTSDIGKCRKDRWMDGWMDALLKGTRYAESENNLSQSRGRDEIRTRCHQMAYGGFPIYVTSWHEVPHLSLSSFGDTCAEILQLLTALTLWSYGSKGLDISQLHLKEPLKSEGLVAPQWWNRSSNAAFDGSSPWTVTVSFTLQSDWPQSSKKKL